MTIRTFSLPQCYLCQSQGSILYDGLSDRLYDVPGKWAIRQCSSLTCGLKWLDPMPIPEDIHKLYAQYYTHSNDVGRQQDVAHSLLDWLARQTLPQLVGYPDKKRSWLSRLLSLGLKCIPPLREVVESTVLWLDRQRPGRILDVGCGAGVMLSRFRELGWEVHGVEPDPISARLAADSGIPVHIGTLEQASFPDCSFDVVTMSHVIEHLPDPAQTLAEVLRILVPGGRLLLATPNPLSMGVSTFRGNWLGWDPPRHLFIFTPLAIRNMICQSGLSVAHLKTSARSIPVIYRYSRAIERYGHCKGAARRFPLSLWFPTIWYYFREYSRARTALVGEEICVEACKALNN